MESLVFAYLIGLVAWMFTCGLLNERERAPLGIIWPVALPIVAIVFACRVLVILGEYVGGHR